MAIGEVFEFDIEAYRRKISSPSYSDAELETNIIRKRRNRQSAVCGAGAGIGVAWITFGASAVASAASIRSYSVASQKLEALEDEWMRRGHTKIPYRTMRDRVIPGALGAATLGMHSFMGGRSLRKATKKNRMARYNSDPNLGATYRPSYDDSIYARTLVGSSSVRRLPYHEDEFGTRQPRNSENPLPPGLTQSRPSTSTHVPHESAPPYSAPPAYPSNQNPDTKNDAWEEEYWRQDSFGDERAVPAYSSLDDNQRRATSRVSRSS